MQNGWNRQSNHYYYNARNCNSTNRQTLYSVTEQSAGCEFVTKTPPTLHSSLQLLTPLWLPAFPSLADKGSCHTAFLYCRFVISIAFIYYFIKSQNCLICSDLLCDSRRRYCPNGKCYHSHNFSRWMLFFFYSKTWVDASFNYYIIG